MNLLRYMAKNIAAVLFVVFDGKSVGQIPDGEEAAFVLSHQEQEGEFFHVVIVTVFRLFLFFTVIPSTKRILVFRLRGLLCINRREHKIRFQSVSNYKAFDILI